MNDKHSSFLAGLPHRVREFLEDWPARRRHWRQTLRDDPSLLWRHPAVRIGGLVVAGVCVLLLIHWAITAFTPRGSASLFAKPTPWATLYVACTNPSCRAWYTTQQPMDFKAWPLTCEKCGQTTVYRAEHCKVCRKWYAVPPGAPATCPLCAEKKAAKQRAAPASKPTGNPDDAEDPW